MSAKCASNFLGEFFRKRNLPVFEKSEPAVIEKMVDVRREQESVRLIHSLGIRAFRPRLDMAGHEEPQIANISHAASALNFDDAISKQTLLSADFNLSRRGRRGIVGRCIRGLLGRVGKRNL